MAENRLTIFNSSSGLGDFVEADVAEIISKGGFETGTIFCERGSSSR